MQQLEKGTRRRLHHQSPRRHAFTLIELLVVITIIMVLAALLLPALKAAKDHAKTVACNNNQRQISAGFSAFLGDHNGFYPYQFSLPKETFWMTNSVTGQPCTPTSGYGWTAKEGWYYLFSPYIGGLGVDKYGNPPYTSSFFQIMRCPANPFYTSPWANNNEYYGGVTWSQWAYMPPVNPCSYSLNDQLIALTWGLPQGSGPGCGYSWNSAAGWTKRTNMTDIRNPAGAALLTENPLAPGIINNGGLVSTPSLNPWLQAPDPWIHTVPMPFTGGEGLNGGSDASQVTNWCGGVDNRWSIYWMRPDCNYMVSAFHNLGMNVLFFDGHVARITKAQLLSYSADTMGNPACPTCICGGAYAGLNNTAGGIFWTDGHGEGSRWNYNQFPGYDFY